MHLCGKARRQCSSSFLQGTRPRFASGTLMSLRTTPPLRARLTGAGGSYTLRKRHQGTLSGALRSEARRSGAPERVGSPAGAEEGYSVPTRPVGTRTNTAFRAENKAKRKAPESSPEGFPYSCIRRQSLPRCRSPPQPSAHEYAAPYPAPSPPGTRPRGESPWRSHRDPHRRTAP